MDDLAQPPIETAPEEEVLGVPDLGMLRTLLGNLDGMLFRYRNDADFTLEFVSEGCMRLTGYPAASLLDPRKTRFAELIHSADRARWQQASAQALQARERYAVEYRIVRADGAIRWVSERGMAQLNRDADTAVFEGFIEDVTERKRVEEALEELELRCQSMFENALEGMFRASADGQWLNANRALARIYGYDSPEELLRSMHDTSRAELRRRLEVDGDVNGFECQATKQNGEVIWVSMTGRAQTDADGRVTHYEGTVEDVTERRRFQAHIEHQANFDALTGLANRALLDDRLRQ
ncbi:MAG TPA: PAS domain S-box protein, partial [Steroidobacteraceae bacterium]|nr:PAS domain S-box protein [Steroidobacteraceae bacterium]